MANTSRIVSTPQSGLRPLGVQGQLATQAYSQLTRLIEARLSARHAAILAEPVADPTAGRIDWYAAADGPVEPLASLSDADRNQTLDTLHALGADIAGLARDYAGQADPDRQQVGKLLTLALQYPSEQDVYRVGDQPVVVRWGHAPEDSATPPLDLSRSRAFEPRPRFTPGATTTAAADEAARTGDAAVLATDAAWVPGGRGDWLRFLAWLLLGLLIMLAILGVWHRWWPERLMIAPWRWHVAQRGDDALGVEKAREDALRLELAKLRDQFAHRRAGCAQAATTAPPIAPPVSTPKQAPTGPGPTDQAKPPAPSDQAADPRFDERLAREHAKDGELQVSLLWNNVNDLDLAVIEPNGQKINYHTRTSSSGGTLDVDMNAQNVSSEPVENIYWPPGHAAPGRYKVYVRYFQANPGPQSGAPTSFTIRIKMGDRTEEASGTLPLGAPPKLITEFDVPPHGGTAPNGTGEPRGPAKR